MEEKIKEPGLFDFINQINLKTNNFKFNKKSCSGYMLVLHYSHENGLLEKIVNPINKLLFQLESENVYQYFYDKIPKGKRFTKWPKKDKNDIKKDEIVKNLMEKYDISEKEAKEYI